MSFAHSFVSCCSVDGLRGGALASGIHSHILHGDPDVARYVQLVMKRVAAPIFRMIRRWVFEGELEDAHVRHTLAVINPKVLHSHYHLSLRWNSSLWQMQVSRTIACGPTNTSSTSKCCQHSSPCKWGTCCYCDELLSSTQLLFEEISRKRFWSLARASISSANAAETPMYVGK